MVYPAMEAAEKLAAENIHATVVNARFVKPLDSETILSLARKHQTIITVEEAYLAGGFGSAVMELLEENGLLETVSLHRMGVADEIVTHGDPKILLAKYGLNADGIYAKAKESITESSDQHPKPQRLKAVK
jgi:1-deoxy-D-xylulose-5-phosphate synthase